MNKYGVESVESVVWVQKIKQRELKIQIRNQNFISNKQKNKKLFI